MTGLLPNTELVVKHWALAAVADIDSAGVATTLPDTPWPNDEFLQIMSVGGTPDGDTPLFSPVVSFNCFAKPPGNSTKPPWNQAAQLGMRLIRATYEIRYRPATRVLVQLPTGYDTAVVTSAKPVSDLRRVPSDPSQYAVYNIDIQFAWMPVGLVIA